MIFSSLMLHQKKMLAYLKRHSPCGLFAFLGSGKSLAALAYADHIEAKRILITADKNNIINTWPDEIYRHTNFDVVVRPTEAVLRGLSQSPTVPLCVLINYELLYHRRLEYFARPWDLWIGDESSEFKDQRTDKHKGIALVSDFIPHKLILNGKLMTERLEDVYGQLKLIGGGKRLGQTLHQFRNRFMQPDPQGYGWMPKRSALTRVQKEIKNISYWLKNDGSIRMPQRHYHLVKVEMTNEQKRIDRELKTTFAACFEKAEIETNFAAVVYQKRIQLCGGVFRPTDKGAEGKDYREVKTNKAAVLHKIIANNPESKIVVWHTYIPETKILRALVGGTRGKTFVVESPKDTKQLVGFAKSDAPAILLIRTSLCKGLNQLADADVAVFYSNPLSYARRAQAEGRTSRITTKSQDTHIVDIVTDDGADIDVYRSLEKKRSFSFTLESLRNMV